MLSNTLIWKCPNNTVTLENKEPKLRNLRDSLGEFSRWWTRMWWPMSTLPFSSSWTSLVFSPFLFYSPTALPSDCLLIAFVFHTLSLSLLLPSPSFRILKNFSSLFCGTQLKQTGALINFHYLSSFFLIKKILFFQFKNELLIPIKCSLVTEFQLF